MSLEIRFSDSTVQPAPDSPRPWGFWATVGWTVIIVIGYLLAQLAGGILIAMVGGVSTSDPDEFANNGMVLATMTCLATPIAVGFCVLFASLRKQLPVKKYLALQWPDRATVRRWCIGLLLLVLASDSLTSLLGKPIVPDFMVEAYETAGLALPLLWIALIIAAPFSEEFLFRGFLFAGLQHSRLGNYGAILITSLIWASIHLQYDLYGMATIFVSGLFLGWVRVKTDSLWLCVLLHALMNLIATLELIAFRFFVS